MMKCVILNMMQTIIYIGISFSILLKIVEGNLKCHCNTPECRAQDVQYCMALSFCYTELLVYQGNSQITLGCIDEATPLMCDRNLQRGGGRNQFFNPSPQLLLTCCRSNRCNNYPEETAVNSPRGLQVKYRNFRLRPLVEPTEAATIIVPTTIPARERFRLKVDSNKNEFHLQTGFNPLLVAIPAAIGCLLLCILILIIFFTKQRCLRKTGLSPGTESDSGSNEFREKCLNPIACRTPLTVFYSSYIKLDRYSSSPPPINNFC